MMDSEDKVQRLGGAALGARLRRLSAMIDADAARIYEAEGVVFEQRWFGVIDRLSGDGPMTVGALASMLGISHASVSETRRSLEAQGLISATPDENDARRRLLSLSQKGCALVERMAHLWQAFDVAAVALNDEAGGVTVALDRLDAALARRSLSERIYDSLRDGKPEPNAGNALAESKL